MSLNRRKVLLGISGVAGGSGLIVGTGAFTTVQANRTASVDVAGDASAFLSLMSHSGPNGVYADGETGGMLQINLDGTGISNANGLNANAITTIDNIVAIMNRGTQDVTSLTFTIDVSGTSDDIAHENAIAITTDGAIINEGSNNGQDLLEPSSGSAVTDDVLSPGETVPFGLELDLLNHGVQGNFESSADVTLLIKATTTQGTNGGGGSSGGDNDGGSGGGGQSIVGTVQGSTIQGATVSAYLEDDKVATATTDENGQYSLTDLTPTEKENARVVVSFDNVDVGGSTVAGGGAKQANGNDEVNFDFAPSASNVEVISGIGIEGINEVRYFQDEANGNRQIANVYQLQAMKEDLTADYELVQDIDASETAGWNDGDGFEPVGPGGEPGGTANFSGTFNGSHHTITDLVINSSPSGGTGIGLFGVTTAEAVIEAAGLENVSINTYSSNGVGGLVGWNYGVIRKSYVTGSVSGDATVGGLVGNNDADDQGKVIESYATATVSGQQAVGGLVGNNDGGIDNAMIRKSYATGDVFGDGDDGEVGGLVGDNFGKVATSYATGNVTGTEEVGGLVGFNDGGGEISESYATGNVSGENLVGGLVGATYSGIVNESYATGTVTGNSDTGGLVGSNARGNYSGDITNSYWDETSTGQDSSASGGDGSTGLSTDSDGDDRADEMVGASASSTMGNFDFTITWNGVSDPEDYPVLQALNEQEQLNARN
jgi:hypothetical protein